jgi:hypothetical protein
MELFNLPREGGSILLPSAVYHVGSIHGVSGFGYSIQTDCSVGRRISSFM